MARSFALVQGTTKGTADGGRGIDGKVTNTKIAVLQVWQKQDSGWKLLARASYRLPEPAEKS